MAIINGTFLPDVLFGTSEDDTINGFGGLDTISGGDGNDVIDGGEGDDVLIGGNGDDILIGGTGPATLLSLYNGGEGNDLMIASILGVAEDFDGGDGIDTVSFAARTSGVTTFLSVLGIPLLDTLRNVENVIGSAFDDVIAGDASNNVLDGGSGDDQLDGGGGDDVLIGGLGADTMAGGAGNDTYYVDQSGDLVTEAAGGGNDRVVTSISYTLGTSNEVETLEAAAGSAAINLTGNEFNQILYGNAGENYLDGGLGNDTLVGFGGNDSYVVDDNGDYVAEVAGGGNDIVYVRGGFTLGAGQEVEILAALSQVGTAPIVIVGNDLSQVIYGNAGANYLDGGSGNDTLVGFGGNDSFVVDDNGDYVTEAAGGGSDIVYVRGSFTLGAGQEVEILAALSQAGTAPILIVGNEIGQILYGNAGDNYLDGAGGNDTLVGFGGNDSFVVDDNGDYVAEGTGGGNDIVYVRGSFILGAGQEVETLAAFNQAATAPIVIVGNEVSQVIYGNSGDNYLDGGTGTDVLQGFAGNDVYVVDSLDDQVVEAAGQGSDVVYARASYALGAGQDVETLFAISKAATTAMDLSGNALANQLYGNDGANTLNGGGGADFLEGYGGADTFQFTTALGGGNVDTIAGFLSGTDKIALDDAVFTALGGLGTLNANAFVTGAAAADADDRIIYNSATGALLYDADGTGGAAAVQFATLATGLTLTASDFQVI